MGAGLIGEPPGMDLAGDEVDAGQQADCALALIFGATGVCSPLPRSTAMSRIWRPSWRWSGALRPIQIRFVVAALMHKAGTEEPAWKAVLGLLVQFRPRFELFVNVKTARAARP
jgi:hypothetical protein